jgi:ribonuclease G
MSKEIYISSTPHETRLAIVEKDELTEIYYERENEYTLAGSIYNGRVTRVLPGMQSSFVDIGLERDAFLYITDFMEEQGDAADFDAGDATRSSGRGERRERGEGRGETRGETRTEGRSEGRGEGGRSEGRDRRRGAPQPQTIEAQPVEDEDAVDLHGEAEERTDPSAEGAGEESADGSRRWRGRRGRRRGRTGERREGAPSEQGTGSLPAAPVEPAAIETSEPVRSADRNPDRNPDRRRGDRSDRGDRGRRDRSNEVQGRQEAIRERFAPRGPRPGPAEESVNLSASAEPFILPGESLSKYRRGEAGENPTSDARSASLRPAAGVSAQARPSTEFALPTAWDGGVTLPGESLSRYRPSDRPEPGRAQPEVAGEGRERRRDRDQRRGRSDRRPERSLTPEEAVQPGVTSQHELEPNNIGLSDDVPAFEVIETEERLDLEHHIDELVAYEPATDLAPAAAGPEQESVLEAVEEFHETVAEYEPGEEASASYRVDPSGPSEFRQPGTVDDAMEPLETPEVARFLSDESHGSAGTSTDDQFTTVQPAGEMISEWPSAPEAQGAPADVDHPSAPIEHETAVQSTHLANAEPAPALSEPSQGLAPESGQTSAQEQAQSFAPGDGQLEEELLDEEDGELPALHAAGSEEYEEETLEGAADLGTMIREMSIDELMRPDVPDHDMDEEDDFDIAEEDMEEDELEADGALAASDLNEIEEDEAAEEDEYEGAAETDQPGNEVESPRGEATERESGRRVRRDGRRGTRGREREPRRTGGGGHRGGGRPGRHSMQATDLPAISDLLKPGQEVLVQIAKEPIAKKGARITSHIALPGRFLVFMPTVNHVGVSRKIESDGERRRLKEILLSEKGEASGGFIVRTAASGASEEELRSDLRFLLNLWADIKQRSESSKSPALIYHDLNLVERILRDQVTDNFSAIWVDTETEYERVLRFLQRFQPSLIRRVKLYSKETPLFEQFGIQEEINKALRSKVWLKSGGSIVINQTEALVAIDINTGKYVGKTTRLEDTIVKTNLDAIPEIVRQIRLRDLGGIIVIDFIDMDERKNRQKVLIALEEELKKDRAPSKVLQFNDFGLVAITRKRVKQSLERTLSTTCGICAGTGMTKSPVTVCNEIFIELRKMHRHLDKGDIMMRVHPEVVKQLKSTGGKWLQEMEEMSGKTILVKSDPSLHPEQFDIH